MTSYPVQLLLYFSCVIFHYISIIISSSYFSSFFHHVFGWLTLILAIYILSFIQCYFICRRVKVRGKMKPPTSIYQIIQTIAVRCVVYVLSHYNSLFNSIAAAGYHLLRYTDILNREKNVYSKHGLTEYVTKQKIQNIISLELKMKLMKRVINILNWSPCLSRSHKK